MQQLSKGCLLVIEDNDQVRSSLQISLGRAGYLVSVATNEEEALACVRRERIHGVLLGEAFAAAQGFAFLARLRRLTTLPIIILAELTHPDDLAIAFRLGANDYIVKPIQFNVLLARLSAVLRRADKNTLRQPWKIILPQELVCSTLQ
jgi:two-component system, OmpR family, response regulator